MRSTAPHATLGGIQALRFFAAFAVLFAHLQHEIAENIMPGIPFRQFHLIDGGIGVDVFFVISGFIIYHVSQNEFGKKNAPFLFLVRRFVRVSPLYYLCTLATLIIGALASNYVHSGQISAQQVISSFLFIPYRNSVDQIAPVLKLGWTLNYEMFFYVVFALSLGFSRSAGLKVIFFVISAISVINYATQSNSVLLNFWGDSIVFEFIGGIVVAIGFERQWRIPKIAAQSLIGGALIALAMEREMGVLFQLPRAIFAGIPAVVIVAATAYGGLGNKAGWLQRGLAGLGGASYALYLTHPFSLRGMMVVWSLLTLPKSPYLFIVAAMAVAIMIATLTHLLIEKPLNQKSRRSLDKVNFEKGFFQFRGGTLN